LVSASERFYQSQDKATLASMGIQMGEVGLDFAKMQLWKQQIINRLTDGVQKLIKSRHIEVVHGLGYFLNSKEMRVEGDYGSHRFSFDNCVLAVGAAPVALPDLPFDGSQVLTPSQALALHELPATLAIWGQDYISLELATIFARLGTKVSLLVPGERPLPEIDATAVRLALAGLRKLGVAIITNAGLPGRSEAGLTYAEGKNTLPAATPLVMCVEVQARTNDLNLHEVGLTLGERGALEVAADQRTRVDYVFAVGDCTQHRPALATGAIRQAKVSAEALTGHRVAYMPQALPLVIHSAPEIATVGLSAEAAQTLGYSIKSGRFALAANGRALTLGADTGTALVVADADSEALLGVTIVGPRAGDLIGEATLAIEMGATLTDIAEVLHPHPGLGELLQESAESALGQVIHQLELSPITR
jgi:dihydrolipoamide dehydrogenase